MQEIYIISSDDCGPTSSKGLVNERLSENWTVVSATPMSGVANYASNKSLVVIQSPDCNMINRIEELENAIRYHLNNHKDINSDLNFLLLEELNSPKYYKGGKGYKDA
jgi:hypothetical protein